MKAEASPYATIYWDEYQRDPERFDYNIIIDQTVTGPIDGERLQRALNGVVTLYPLLNSHLIEEGGRLFWVSNDDGSPLKFFDSAEGQETFGQAPFCLESGPLYRWGLFKREEGNHDLLLVIHHALIDGASAQVFLDLISGLYNNRNIKADTATQSLEQVFLKLRKRVEEHLSKGALDFWRHAFTEHAKEPSLLPYLPSSDPCVVGIGERLFDVHKSALTSFISLSSAFKVFLAAWGSLMSRYCNQRQLVISFPIAIREGKGLAFGAHVNSLLFPFSINEESTFQGLYHHVSTFIRDISKGAKYIPTDKILEVVPLSKLNLAFCQTDLIRGSCQFEGCQVVPNRRFNRDLPKQDLILEYEEEDTVFHFRLRYRKELFAQEQIEQLAELYPMHLLSLIRHPQQKLATLPLLNVYPTQVPTRQGDAEITESVEGHIFDLFQQQVALHPERIAVSDMQRQLTYQQLDNLVRTAAEHLSPYAPYVVIQMERSVEAIIAILAALRKGSAYVPIDLSFPNERVKRLLEQLDHPSVLTKGCGIAYVMFTSGTTGTPKGVMIHEASVINFVQNMIKAYSFTERDVLLQFSSLAFDVSILEIFSALCCGAHLTILPEGGKGCTETLSQWLIDKKVTFAHLPPALLPLLNPDRFPDLRLVEVGGEQSSGQLAKQWLTDFRHYYNSYGPTETTVTVSLYRCSINSPDRLPIGKPIAGHKFYIVDENMHLVPMGVEGNLYISGPGLAKGYLNAPDLTAERFIPNPFGQGIHRLMYKTGDKARLREDGNVEFLKRSDDQIKIRGYRIELSEIETLLLTFPGIQQSVVLFHEKQLIAFYSASQVIDSATIEEFLGRSLPHYMLPNQYCPMAYFPLNNNGKIDRKQLMATIGGTRRYRLLKDYTPRTDAEWVIYQAWKELLNMSDIGIRDNFFHLGGNSLLALQLVRKLNRYCQSSLNLETAVGDGKLTQSFDPESFPTEGPFTTWGMSPSVGINSESKPCITLPSRTAVSRLKGTDILQNKTIETQALLIQGLLPRSQSQLLTLQPGDGSSHLMCVHPAGGTAFCYSQLARFLPAEMRVIGIQAQGIEDREIPIEQIESMAASYCTLIKKIHLKPPYTIVGWSFGGIVAFEMVRQLSMEGIESAAILLDTAAPIQNNQNSAAPITRSEFLEKFVRFHGTFDAVADADIDRYHAVYNANVHAFKAYTPAPCQGQVYLFKCGAIEHAQEDCLQWEKLSPQGFSVHSIEGEHWTLMDEPHIHDVAKKIVEVTC